MDRELISIIVPVYNVQEYLIQCLDSLRNQTYTNIEIVLVDDGSTDKSGQICDDYALMDSRIIVIHKRNGGLSDARNNGLDVASGQLIGFVDSDDWIDPKMYESLYTQLKLGNHDIAVCGLIREYKNKSVPESLKSRVYVTEEGISALLSGIELHDHAWSKLYRRQVFDDIRFPKNRYFEDVLTTYKTFLKARSIIVVPTALYHYRQRGGSIVRDGFNSRSFELLNAVETISRDVQLIKWQKELSSRILAVKLALIYDLATNGSKKDVDKYWETVNGYITELKSVSIGNCVLQKYRIFKLIYYFRFLHNRLLFYGLRVQRLLFSCNKNF